jgi:hypothetical protein
MLRAGLSPGQKRFVQTRALLQESIPGDKAGFSAKADGEDIQIIHNEGMFLLKRRNSGAGRE